MSLEILHDPRIRSVQWHDLMPLSRLQALKESVLCLPWLLLSLYLAAEQLYLLALLASFVFFLTGLRQSHGAFHYTLGLPRLATELVMFLLSVLMLGSMHAVQFNHLQHHSTAWTTGMLRECALACRLGWHWSPAHGSLSACTATLSGTVTGGGDCGSQPSW
jgi:hypothetical protein